MRKKDQTKEIRFNAWIMNPLMTLIIYILSGAALGSLMLLSGIPGPPGPEGKAGKGISEKQLKTFNDFINDNKSNKKEAIVGTTSYSFGFAPTITGFVYLTNHGRIFKLDNKTPQTLGQSIEFVSTIADRKDFSCISRIAYGEDIKQYFTATTSSGIIYTSEDLKTWDENTTQPVLKR